MRRVLIGVTAVMSLATLAVVVLLLRPPEGAARAPAPPARLELPEAPVRYGSTRPMWEIALFVDLEAPASRQAFSRLTRAVADGALVDGPTELRLLHAPEGGCAAADRGRFACTGARVVECAEQLSRGTGVVLAGEVFDLQWEPPRRRDLAELMERAARRGIDATALARCVAEERAIERRVARHVGFAAERGLAQAPGGFLRRAGEPDQIAAFDAQVTAEELRTLSTCLAHGRCQEAP